MLQQKCIAILTRFVTCDIISRAFVFLGYARCVLHVRQTPRSVTCSQRAKHDGTGACTTIQVLLLTR
jgi:hypothetical protein